MARFTAFPSDSDDDNSGSDSPPRPTRPANGKRKPTYAVPSSSASSSEGSAGDGSYVEGVTGGEESSIYEEEDAAENEEEETEEEEEAQPAPWAKQLNLEPQRVNVMQSSLFRVPDLVKVQDKNSLSFLKHRRPSDIRRDLEPKPRRTRTSFTQPRSQPPPRKYARVALSESVCANHENLYLDAGLSMGRSFRVGWGPGNKLVHLGSLNITTSPPQSANSSVVNVTTVGVDIPDPPRIIDELLARSSIPFPSKENNFIPSATPKPDLTFSSVSSLFSTQDKSHCASVFRLGHALFDPLNLHLKNDVCADIQERITAFRRADALSTWLSRTASPSVEQDIKAAIGADSAQVAFLYLTGNQVEKAIEVLLDGGNVRLATMISQIPGDADFRSDLHLQLQIWKEEKADTFVSEAIRKLYALASGEVDIVEGNTRKESIDIPRDLDWLRVLGLRLWYASPLGTSLQETFGIYEQLIEASNRRIGVPRPWYSKPSSSMSDVKDGLFNLIKLFVSEDMPLESALDPPSFSPNPRDYRIPWFLYVFLALVLQIRDFSDRKECNVIDEETGECGDVVGYSRIADMLTTSYAAQLQQQGQIQEAAYVLMYLELDALRKHAIKEMLCQSAPLIEEHATAGLNGSLRLPEGWVYEAKALYAFYEGDVYHAYELYTRAKAYQAAHELAVMYLAPEAVLRDELEVLKQLFTVLERSEVDNFSLGGQLFIDYVLIVSRVPELREKVQTEGVALNPAEEKELDDLSTKIPRITAVLPDILHDRPGTGGQCRAALSHMLSRLLDCVDPSVPMKAEIPPGLVEEGARIRHIQASAYGSFMRTIEELA